MAVLQGLEPQAVFHYFEQLSRIPRPSGHPEAVVKFCECFAKAHDLPIETDRFGNVIIRKSGDPDKEPIILQGHLDMVCVKTPETDIDFLHDPLPLAHDGEYVFSRGTSLGADDGIAIAMIMAILSSDTHDLPPIEAVFTMDEETGMFGAEGLDASVLKSKRMLNLDSEAEGTFWVSCAGGERVKITLRSESEKANESCFSAVLTGLSGGHSGTEIDKGHLNAARTMAELLSSVPGVRLVSLDAGKVDNAIPCECTVVCCGSADDLRHVFEEKAGMLRAHEPGIQLTISPCSAETAWTMDGTNTVLSLIRSLPNGVQAMSRDIEGLVETSLNLGVCRVCAENAELHFSVRSSVDAARKALVSRMLEISAAFGAQAEASCGYPAWQFRKDSPLRDTAMQAHRKLFGTEPSIEAIHAGLECGLFCGKIPALDCISLGPDLLDIHTPSERLSIASTERTYRLVWEILRSL